jgi:hypothetical protein
MEAAWTASGGGASKKDKTVSAADIQLESALAAIGESDSEPDDY